MARDADENDVNGDLTRTEVAMLAAARSANRAAWFAAITSLAAIMIGVYSAYLQRQQTQAEFWPHLEWGFSELPEPRFLVTNNGVGPALIAGIELSVDGQPMARWSDVLKARGADSATIDDYVYSSMGGSRTIMAGETIDVFTPVSKHADIATNRQQRKQLLDLLRGGGVVMRYCYCSVFGDCVRLLDDGSEHEVRQCPRSDPRTFLD